jgi:hypothetical protein
MVQPLAFHVVMLSSPALLFLAQGRVLCGARGPVDSAQSVTISPRNEGGLSLHLLMGEKCLLQPFSLRHRGWRKVDSPEILFHRVGIEKLDPIGIDTLTLCADQADDSGRKLGVASVL